MNTSEHKERHTEAKLQNIIISESVKERTQGKGGSAWRCGEDLLLVVVVVGVDGRPAPRHIQRGKVVRKCTYNQEGREVVVVVVVGAR